MMQIKTKSENTVKAYEFLASHKGEAFTIKAVAEAIGATSSQVTGGLVSLEKKGVLVKTDVEVNEKPYKAYQWALEAEFDFETAKKMTDKGVVLLQYLQKVDGTDMTAQEIAAELEMAPIAVNGVLNGLIRKGLAFRDEAIVQVGEDTKTMKFVTLTDAGREYKF